MQRCPGCEFLVPPAWARCRQCGSPLSDTATPAPAVVRPPTPTPGVARVPAVAPAVPPVAPLPTVGPPPSPARVRASGFGAEFSRPVTITEPVVFTETSRTRPRGRRAAWALAVVVALAVAGWVAVDRLRGEAPVPDDLRAYVEDGVGEEVVSAAGGFRVLLPTAPLPQSSLTLSVAGETIQVSVTAAESRDWGLGVMWFDLPAGTDVSERLDGVAEGVASGSGGAIADEDEVTHQGHPGTEYLVESASQGWARVREVPLGSRLYVLLATASSRSTPGFDRLADSFVLSGV